MPQVPHPNVSWVSCNVLGPGIFQCSCTLCGQAMPAGASGRQADAFASAHAQHQPAPQSTHLGAGDLIAKMTGALGIKPCTPCKARQQALNGMFPRVMRRR